MSRRSRQRRDARLSVDRDRDLTVGRGTRSRDVLVGIDAAGGEPDVEIRRSRPGVNIEIDR
jgi:hypothetical protein